MPAHLPFAAVPDPLCDGGEVAQFAPAIQHCVRTARKLNSVALIFRAIGPIGSTVILYLVSFVSDTQSRSNVEFLKNVIGAIAFVISLAAVINELFPFRQLAKKYDSCRRALADFDVLHQEVLSRSADCTARGKLFVWARENVSELERLLDEEGITDVELVFSATRKPLP